MSGYFRRYYAGLSSDDGNRMASIEHIGRGAYDISLTQFKRIGFVVTHQKATTLIAARKLAQKWTRA